MGGGSLNLEILRGGGAGLKQSWKSGWKGRGGGKKVPSVQREGGLWIFFWNNPLSQYVWVCRQFFSHVIRQFNYQG